MNKVTLSIIFALFAGPVLADKNSNVNLNGNQNSNKAEAKGGKSSSQSGALAINGGNNLEVKTGGAKLKTDYNSKSYALGLPDLNVPVNNSGFNILGIGATTPSQKVLDLRLLILLGQDDLTKAQKQGICARLSDGVSSKIDDCTRKEKPKSAKTTLKIRVSKFNELDDHDYEEFGY